MYTYLGNDFLLKIRKDTGGFETIGGMRTTRFELTNQLLDSSNKETGNWRKLMEGGKASLSISGAGIFTNSDAEKLAKDLAFKGKLASFMIHFGNGDQITGEFLISSYERIGNFQEEETYTISLESSGRVYYWEDKNSLEDGE